VALFGVSPHSCSFKQACILVRTFVSSLYLHLLGRINRYLAEPLRLIVWHFISLFLLCFPLYFVFCLFSLFLVLVFPILFFLCLFCACFIFAVLSISSASVSPPSTYCRALFSAPLRQTSNAPVSGKGLLERDRFFLVFSFCLYLVFPYISIVFLLVIMLSPRWFGWIPFGPDLCVMDVCVTLAFGSRRKIDPDFCVVDECIS
jgi:hypothetical protein